MTLEPSVPQINNNEVGCCITILDVAIYVILIIIMHGSLKIFPVMYLFLLSGIIFGKLQRTGKTIYLCLATSVRFLSGLLHNHIIELV